MVTQRSSRSSKVQRAGANGVLFLLLLLLLLLLQHLEFAQHGWAVITVTCEPQGGGGKLNELLNTKGAGEAHELKALADTHGSGMGQPLRVDVMQDARKHARTRVNMQCAVINLGGKVERPHGAAGRKDGSMAAKNLSLALHLDIAVNASAKEG